MGSDCSVSAIENRFRPLKRQVILINKTVEDGVDVATLGIGSGGGKTQRSPSLSAKHESRSVFTVALLIAYITWLLSAIFTAFVRLKSNGCWRRWQPRVGSSIDAQAMLPLRSQTAGIRVRLQRCRFDQGRNGPLHTCNAHQKLTSAAPHGIFYCETASFLMVSAFSADQIPLFTDLEMLRAWKIGIHAHSLESDFNAL